MKHNPFQGIIEHNRLFFFFFSLVTGVWSIILFSVYQDILFNQSMTPTHYSLHVSSVLWVRVLWYLYALRCVQPGIQYFHDKFGDDTQMPLVKAARLFSPIRIHEIQPTAADLDQLKIFPFLVASYLPHLKLELPSYSAKASQVNPEADFKVLEW